MTNYIRGDLLLYTNKGLKRLDKISKHDVINGNNIDEITKHNLKGYSYLFKIKTLHNIDNYYLSGNNKIYCIQNIPYDLKMKDCPNFIEDNKRICTPSFINVNELTDFDYIGYPIDISDKTILLKKEEILNLSSENIKKVIKGFIEINSVINTNDKTVFYFLKNLFMKIGILLNANYINNNYVIKIPQSLEETEKNYFIYDNYIWSKIKKIGKTDKYFGHLYSIKMANNSKYLTEIGVIS